MTQKEIAKALGFSEAYIWRVINGRDNMGWRNAKRMANLVGGEPHIWLRDGGTSKQRKAAVNTTKETVQ